MYSMAFKFITGPREIEKNKETSTKNVQSTHLISIQSRQDRQPALLQFGRSFFFCLMIWMTRVRYHTLNTIHTLQNQFPACGFPAKFYNKCSLIWLNNLARLGYDKTQIILFFHIF